MTSLTEQWKKGELEEGMYYIKYKGSEKLDWWHGYYWEDSWSEGIEEVLAPVPSYVEWKNITNTLDYEYKGNLNLREENQKLKDLLKECYKMLAQYHVENSEPSLDKNIELLTKIDEVLK